MFGINLKRLLRIYFLEPRLVTAAFGGAALALVMSVAGPLAVRNVVQKAIESGRRDLLLPLTAIVLGATALKAAGVFVRKLYAGRTGIALEVRMRNSLYDHVHGLDMAFHDSMPTGQLMSRVSSDMQRIGHTMGAIPFFSAMTMYLVLVSVILFAVDALMAALVVVALPFMARLAVVFTRRLDPVVRRTQQHLGEVTSVAEETVAGIRVVKAFGREDFQVGRLGRRAAMVQDQALKAIDIRAALQPMFEFLPALILAVVVWVGGLRVIGGQMDLADLVLFALYATQLGMPVRAIGWIVTDLQQTISASSRIFEVLDTKSGIEDRPGATTLVADGGNILYDSVRYENNSQTILDNVSLEVPSGTSLALVGPTGCGKSTLLRLILRFIEPTSGRILIDGTDIASVTLHSVRIQTGTVFEETFLFSDTIATNIAFGRPDAADEDIVEAAVLAQAHQFIEDLPDGYDTVVGEQGYTLSGGQRQRLAIARAILMKPKILLLDDATSAVDAEVENLIRRGLQEAMKGRTTLIVARRPQSAALADQVAFMDAGRIVAIGTHEELWDKLPAYRATLDATSQAPLVKAGG